MIGGMKLAPLLLALVAQRSFADEWNRRLRASDLNVYFGCGCFWHVQHGFAELEMSLLKRDGDHITARAAYAGGEKPDDGLVCYHNAQGKADYGSMGHAEVVSLSTPQASFPQFAHEFWSLCQGGLRQDTQDLGAEYRSVVGLPGGWGNEALMKILKDQAPSADDAAKLVEGHGGDGDTLSTGKVYVYDTAKFQAYTAEKYHQFHDDMMDQYGGKYNSFRQFATATQCPGDTAAGGLSLWSFLTS